MKLGKFHNDRCYVWGAYQTLSPGTHLSNSLKKLYAPLVVVLVVNLAVLVLVMVEVLVVEVVVGVVLAMVVVVDIV